MDVDVCIDTVGNRIGEVKVKMSNVHSLLGDNMKYASHLMTYRARLIVPFEILLLILFGGTELLTVRIVLSMSNENGRCDLTSCAPWLQLLGCGRRVFHRRENRVDMMQSVQILTGTWFHTR